MSTSVLAQKHSRVFVSPFCRWSFSIHELSFSCNLDFANRESSSRLRQTQNEETTIPIFISTGSRGFARSSLSVRATWAYLQPSSLSCTALALALALILKSSHRPQRSKHFNPSPFPLVKREPTTCAYQDTDPATLCTPLLIVPASPHVRSREGVAHLCSVLIPLRGPCMTKLGLAVP